MRLFSELMALADERWKPLSVANGTALAMITLADFHTLASAILAVLMILLTALGIAEKLRKNWSWISAFFRRKP